MDCCAVVHPIVARPCVTFWRRGVVGLRRNLLPMKIIFLDIDGVVATERALWAEYAAYFGQAIPAHEPRAFWDHLHRLAVANDGGPPEVSAEYWPFDPEAIRQLYRLQRVTGCRFVVSSAWRGGAEPAAVAKLARLFALKGLRVPLLSVTARLSGAPRSAEISEWLSHHPTVSAYVILNDEEAGILAPHHERLVHTDPHEGFTAAHCDRAIALPMATGC